MENKTVQDILVTGLEKANDKLDTLLQRTAKTNLRSKINSFQIYAIWSTIAGSIVYFFKCGGFNK